MPREFGDTSTSPTGAKCVSWDSWTNPNYLLLVEYPKDTKCISLVALMTQKAAPPATQVKICRTEKGPGSFFKLAVPLDGPPDGTMQMNRIRYSYLERGAPFRAWVPLRQDSAPNRQLAVSRKHS